MGLRLRRLLCGEASPFRGVTSIPNQEASLAGKPEAFRTAERQSRLNARIFRQFGQLWICLATTQRFAALYGGIKPTLRPSCSSLLDHTCRWNCGAAQDRFNPPATIQR